MNGPFAAINFPPEWIGIRTWDLCESVLASDDQTIFAAGGVLSDGTNLLGLVHPGGQRLLRAGPDTRWAIEERFEERSADKRVQEVWRVVVECHVKGAREAWEELGFHPGREGGAP